MRIRSLIIPALAAVALVCSCESEEEKTWNEYAEWREANEDWLHEQVQTGQYSRFVPEWNQNLYVNMRWLNDRSETEGNLTPLYTSECKVKYKGWLYDGTAIDSSYLQTDSLATVVPGNLIDGWIIAFENMHVGDNVEVLMPYTAAYGADGTSDIPPYSVLRFEIELRDITAYEIKY